MKDKVVMVTGASAGIGESCAWAFAGEGAKLILVGRRETRLTTLKQQLLTEYPELRVHVLAMSVTDIDAVAKLPQTLPDEFKPVAVLVNNAGLALGVNTVVTNSVVDAKTLLDTNVLSIVAMCTAFLPGMIDRGEGTVINMGSIAGRYAYGNGSIYNASKYAVTGFTEAARHDLVGTPIRMVHIAPGVVGGTEFSNVRFNDQEKSLGSDASDAAALKVYENLKALSPDDVADTVLYAATRPQHMQVAELLVYATNQAGPKDLARVGLSLGAKPKAN